MSESAEASAPRRPITRQATGTETVTIACNLPQGVVLQLYDVEETEAFLPNGRVIKENVCTLNTEAGQWHVRGVVNRSALAAVGAGDILPDDYRVVRGERPDTGYALTPGVPRNFWEEWLRRNEDSPLVRGKHIFAEGSEQRAVGHARELKELRSGFQGLDQGGDYRVPNGGRGVRKFDRNDNQAGPES